MTATGLTRNQSGYSLIEVVVSTAIAGLAIAALLQAVESSTARIASSRQYATATSLGESMMARVGRDVELTPGVEQGRWDDAFAWRRTIRPYAGPAGASGSEGVELPVFAYEVIVSVNWHYGSRAHEISLRSLRLKTRQVHAPI